MARRQALRGRYVHRPTTVPLMPASRDANSSHKQRDLTTPPKSDTVGQVGAHPSLLSLERKLYSLSANEGQTSTNQSLGRQTRPFSFEEIERLMWAAKIGQHHGIDLAIHRLLGTAGCMDFPLLSWEYILERLKWYEEGDWGQLP